MDQKKTEIFGAEHLAEVDTVAGLGSGSPSVRIYGGSLNSMMVSRIVCPATRHAMIVARVVCPAVVVVSLE